MTLFGIPKIDTKSHGTRFKRFKENTDFLRMPSPHRIFKMLSPKCGVKSVPFLTCLLFSYISGFMWNNRWTSKKVFRPKKKGFFNKILKMSSSVSESEVMTFLKSHIGKMNSYHILTHYLIISNLILSYNLYSSWIICSFVSFNQSSVIHPLHKIDR